MPIRARKIKAFNVPVQEITLRVTAPEDLYEEARAAGMHFWEQVEAYAIRNPLFRTTKRRLFVTEDAPEPVRDMANGAAEVGVGPMYTFHGALAEYVGRHLAPASPDVMVANAGHYFVIARRRSKLPVQMEEGAEPLAVVVRPERGPHGIYTSLGRARTERGESGGLVVVARTCILADATATAAKAILNKSGLPDALAFLQGVDGVFGGLVVRGRDIGVAGGLELAA